MQHRILLDVIAQFAASLDGLDHAGQTFGVKPVGWVEIRNVGLINVQDRDAFQIKTVFVQTRLRRLDHARHIFPATLMQVFHGHFSRHRAQGRDEFAVQQLVNALGFQGAATQR